MEANYGGVIYMAENFVIVESPAKAKTIGKILGKKYVVQASAGHLRDLPKSRMAIDIENDFTPQYMNIRGKASIINALKKQAAASKNVFLATDPDREGEAISWHLAYLLGIDPNSKCRISFNEITQTAILDAVKNPRSIDLNMVDSYQARRVLDRIVGYKISPVLWKKVKKGLSAGRVQSVTTRLICDREDEIEAFNSQEYWSITTEFLKNNSKKSFKGRFHGTKKEKINITNQKEVEEILKKIDGNKFIVDNVKNTEKRKSPSAPFITSTLQQEASRKYNFNSTKTMQIAQQLYEGIDVGKKGITGLVSYIRTDSTRISDDAEAAAKQYITEKYGNTFIPPRKRVYKNKNSSQDAHEAIRPSYLDLNPSEIKDKLTAEQFKLYKLIYDRFVASQMADAIYDVCSVDVNVSNYIFKSKGVKVKFEGFTKVYEESVDDTNSKNEDDEDNSILPELNVGEELNVVEIAPEQHFTQPPARYTEATLVRALEEYGIGRPSTYAPVILTIQQRGYVAREKKTLLPTELGRIVNELMKSSFEHIVDVEFTAQVESRLEQIGQGDVNWVNVLRDFYGDFDQKVQIAEKELEHVVLVDPVSDIPCDKCGRMMVYKTGRFGKFLACPGFPECRNTKAIVEEVGTLCPDCGKMLVYRKTKTGKRYVSCSGYPDCSYTSWNVPLDEKCPTCGSRLERIINRGKGAGLIVCSNKECKYVTRKYTKKAEQ